MRSEFSSNLTVEARRPEYICPYLEPFFQWRNRFLTRDVFYSSVACCTVNGLIALVTSTSNTLVIASILKNSLLRRSRFMLLLVSLSLTDLLVGLLVHPLLVLCRICEIVGRPDLGCAVRTAYQVMGIICVGTSIGHVCLISIERYLAVRFAARYKTLLTFRKFLSIIAFVWIFFILYAILPVAAYPQLRALEIRSGIIAVIVLITACCYTGVFLKVGSSIAAVNTIVSTAQQQRIKKERKLAKFMLFAVFVLALCYFPEMIAYPFITKNPSGNLKLIWIGLNWTQTILYTNSLVNPFLYCWRFQRIRRGVLKLIGRTNFVDFSSLPKPMTPTMISRLSSRPASVSDCRSSNAEERVIVCTKVGIDNTQNFDRFLAVPQI